MSKDSKHDGPQASTQDSVKPTGSAGRPYKSGANVHRGGGPGASKPSPAAEPHKGK